MIIRPTSIPHHLTPLFESPRYIDTPQASEVRLIQQQHQLICIRHKGTDRFQGLGLQQQVLLVDADPIQPEGAIGEESATQICQPWMVQKSWILAILKEKKQGNHGFIPNFYSNFLLNQCLLKAISLKWGCLSYSILFKSVRKPALDDHLDKEACSSNLSTEEYKISSATPGSTNTNIGDANRQPNKKPQGFSYHIKPH